MNHYKQNIKTKSAEGYILLFVLILLNVMMLIGWYSMKSAFMMMKLNQAAWQQAERRYQAQSLLFSIDHAIINELPVCLIPIMPPYELAKKEVSWWQKYSCDGNLGGNSYYYVVEHLMDDACAILDDRDREEIISAAYYRLTLFFSPQNNSFKPKIILQSTVIKPNTVDKPCAGHKHQVMLGRQMWRELK